MRSILVSGLVAAGVIVAAVVPTTVKAEPQVLTVSAMDVVTAGRRGWGGWQGSIDQSNRANIRQHVSASASCLSKCSLTVVASAHAVVEQSNSVD